MIWLQTECSFANTGGKQGSQRRSVWKPSGVRSKKGWLPYEWLSAFGDGVNGRRKRGQVSSGIRSGMLEEISKKELEKYIQAQYSDPARNKQLGSPGYMPKPAEPVALFDMSTPKLSKVRQVVLQARSPSAPGPNGITYKLYKSCSTVPPADCICTGHFLHPNQHQGHGHVL